MKHGLLMLMLVVGLTASAWATTIISQNFDDTGVFTPSVTACGDTGNSGGRWVNMAADPGNGTLSGIRTAYSHSATQSLLVYRGSTYPSGVVSSGIDTSVTKKFEYQLWVYRANSDASAVMLLDDNSIIMTAPNIRLSIFLQGTTGNIMQASSGAWVDTGTDVAVGAWTRLRMVYDMASGSYGAYDLYVMAEGQSETKVGTYTLTGAASTTLNAIRWNPQGTNGGSTYIDDVNLTTTIPEPATMSLLAMGSLLVMYRKKDI